MSTMQVHWYLVELLKLVVRLYGEIREVFADPRNFYFCNKSNVYKYTDAGTVCYKDLFVVTRETIILQ